MKTNYIMIIFLYGEDSYRSKEKLDEIVDHYKKIRKSGLNLVYMDANQADFLEFHGNFTISSMFGETKLIILKNVFSNKKFQENFLGEIKKLQALKDIIVVYESETVDQRLKIFKVLIKECKSQEFGLLDNKNVKLWAVKEFEKYKTKIHPVKSVSQSETVSRDARQFNRVNVDALDLLLSYVGNDLWRLSGEIKKLSNFKNGLVVKKEDVVLLTKPKIETDIFKTIDSLAQKNKPQALSLLHKHIDGGDNPLYLFSMIAYQFKNLLVIKELSEQGLMYASIVKKSGLHPFVVKKNYFTCNQFSFEELKKIYKKIYQTDLDIKTGKIEMETALDLLVSEI